MRKIPLKRYWSLGQNVYLDFIRKAFQQRFAYRLSSYANILSSIVALLVMVSIWSALYKDTAEIKGITLIDMINFTIISRIANSLVRSNISDRIANKVNDGSVEIDFIRPISFKLFLFAEQTGQNLFSTVFNTLPVCIIASIFLGFKFQNDFLTLIFFAVSLILGIIIIYHINYILGLLAFWFKTSYYSRWFLTAFFELFGGITIPLWFYPEFLYKLSRLLPFHLVIFEPVSIYLGKLSLSMQINVVLMQLLWIGILVCTERIVWNRAQELITIHGG